VTPDDVPHQTGAVYDLIEEDFNQFLDESLEPRGPEMLFDLVDALGLAPGATVLDLGCGKGRHSIELAKRFDVVVRGVDPDPSSLDRARRELEMNGISPGLRDLVCFDGGSAEHIPLDDASVDLVWCRDVFCLVEDLDLAYAECRRVLRDDGHVIVYQMFATDRLEPREAAEIYAALDCVPTSMEPCRTEAAIESAGLRIDECIILGTEWGEFFEEQSGKAGRLLLHAGRLLRDPDRYIERFGHRNYEVKLGDCLWHIYRLVGKLSGRVFVLSPEP
jgi:SAM-dependent methyltransferase